MGNAGHVAILDGGVAAWNRWREVKVDVRPDLSGESLSRKDLRTADFSRCSLAGSHLNKTDLDGANLSRANLSGASLQGARLVQATLIEADLTGANAAGADFTEVNASYADFTGAHLAGTVLDGSDLTSAKLDRASRFDATLRKANLRASRLHWSNLTRADLSGANLKRCDLTGVSIIETNLSGANLEEANLRYARLIDSTMEGADLTGCRVYGIAVWNLQSTGAIQSDRIITQADEAAITVDSLELAQFIYLLLNSEKLRQTIMTITSKVVLILGRFTQERMTILQGIREALRNRDYLPVLFDFSAPAARDLTETVATPRASRTVHYRGHNRCPQYPPGVDGDHTQSAVRTCPTHSARIPRRVRIIRAFQALSLGLENSLVP